MKNEKLMLKKILILQSFAPLFILIIIKNINVDIYRNLIMNCYCNYLKIGTKAFLIMFNDKAFGSFIITIIGALWLLLVLIVVLIFREIQQNGFKSSGEQIIIQDSPKDNGAAFLVTYVLPLVVDNVESRKDAIVFIVIVFMLIFLLINSNLFYQNPVLVAMKYRTFTFKFKNPDKDIMYPHKVYIGLTRGDYIIEEDIIKRKYISDGVFLIYNDK